MICAIGELLIDFAQNGVNEYGFPILEAMPGGAPANFLSAVKKSGYEAAFIGKVGKDSFGKLLIESLEKKGINTEAVVEDEDVFTTLAFVTLDGNGERSFSFARKPGADTALRYDEVKLGIIDKCQLLHFGSLSFTDSPSEQAVLRTVEYAVSKNKMISYDPNYRKVLWKNPDIAREKMKKGFHYADIVKLSDDECEFIFGENCEKTADILINEYACSLVFVTLGKNGCYFKNGISSGYTKSTVQVVPVDTTGAGDIFGGTAVANVLKLNKKPSEISSEELFEIATIACTEATKSVAYHGARI